MRRDLLLKVVSPAVFTLVLFLLLGYPVAFALAAVVAALQTASHAGHAAVAAPVAVAARDDGKLGGVCAAPGLAVGTLVLLAEQERAVPERPEAVAARRRGRARRGHARSPDRGCMVRRMLDDPGDIGYILARDPRPSDAVERRPHRWPGPCRPR